MFKQGIKPSDYLPPYLRLDLNVGVEEQHPFVSALDEAMERLCQAGQMEAVRMTRDHFPLERKQAFVQGFGFEIGSLSAEAVDRLYVSIEKLFRLQGTLGGVKMLAEIYFGEAVSVVRRGRDFARLTTHGALSFPILVVDRNDADSTIMVKLASHGDAAKEQEFTRNCQRLVPHGFKVVIQQPLGDAPAPKGIINLGETIRVESRRL